MKKLFLILVLSLSLPACATINKIVAAAEAASSITVSPQAIVIATNTFNAIEASATNYLNLTRCDKTTSKVCRDKAVTRVLIPAVLNARKARDDLIAFQRSHPGQLGTQGLFDALQLSITTLTGIMDTYHIGAVK